MSPSLYSKGSSARIRTLGQILCFARITPPGQLPVAESEMILDKSCAVQNSEAARFFIATSFPKAIQVCVGEALAFLMVALTLHGEWHICQVRRQPPCSGSFACLGSQSSLVNRTNKPVEVVKARCHYWLLFFQGVPAIWPVWAQIFAANAPAQELQLWESHQLPWSKMVPRRSCFWFGQEVNQLTKAVGQP